MKAELVNNETGVILTAECAADYDVIHQMKGCGVRSMRLRRDAEVNHGTGMAGPLEIELLPFHGDPPPTMQELQARVNLAKADLLTAKARQFMSGGDQSPGGASSS